MVVNAQKTAGAFLSMRTKAQYRQIWGMHRPCFAGANSACFALQYLFVAVPLPHMVLCHAHTAMISALQRT